MRCRVCDGPTSVFVRREGVPPVQNVLFDTEREAVASPLASLALSVCERCGFVSNEAFDQALVVYDERYENDQMGSPAFREHVDRVASLVVDVAGEGGDIVEVGCGQGGFLARLDELAAGRCGRIVGFDPAARTDHVAGHRIVRRFFDASATADLDFVPAVAVTRHVIEHIPDPLGFLVDVRSALEPDARLVVETPCVEHILRGDAIQDLFHEHCSYFTELSLRHVLARAGFGDVRVEHVFHGDFLLATATAGGADAPTPDDGGCTRALAEQFASKETERVATWGDRLSSARPARGVWGAAAKGVTFATLVDRGRTLVEVLIDRNPNKQGRFVPITGHPVIGPADPDVARLGTVVVMNPAYVDEVRGDLRERGATPDVLEVS